MSSESGPRRERPKADSTREIILHLLRSNLKAGSSPAAVLALADEFISQYPHDDETRELRNEFERPGLRD